MIYEAQIVLRRDSAQQLMADYKAISEFIESRRLTQTSASHSARVPADAVMAAEQILRDKSNGSDRQYAS